MGDADSTAGASRPQKDLNEHLRSLDSIPLFMKELPAGEGADGESQDATASALDALQSLTFDGTPDEVASNFKKQGNDYFVGKRYTEARAFYTQGLDAYPTDKQLQETLLINRAACNLALKNYGSVLRDCSAALGLNERSVKAFFRSAKALFALSRFLEAIDCCDHALLVDPENKEIVQLSDSIKKRAAEVEKRDAELKERERRKKEDRIALGNGFMARGLYVQTSSKPPDNPNPAHFDPSALAGTPSDPAAPLSGSKVEWRAPDPIRTPIVFPVVFFYPQYRQSDLVSHFHEDSTVGDMLDAMFPASQPPVPWDAKGEYRADNLSIFATTHAQRLLRIGKKLSLREAIDHCAQDADKAAGKERDGMVMQDGILSIIVVPKGDAEQAWIASFKASRTAQK